MILKNRIPLIGSAADPGPQRDPGGTVADCLKYLMSF